MLDRELKIRVFAKAIARFLPALSPINLYSHVSTPIVQTESFLNTMKRRLFVKIMGAATAAASTSLFAAKASAKRQDQDCAYSRTDG